MDQTRTLIGSQTAARLLGISRQHLQRFVAQGVIAPAGRIEGQRGAYIFDRAAVETLADERAAQ